MNRIRTKPFEKLYISYLYIIIAYPSYNICYLDTFIYCISRFYRHRRTNHNILLSLHIPIGNPSQNVRNNM